MKLRICREIVVAKRSNSRILAPGIEPGWWPAGEFEAKAVLEELRNRSMRVLPSPRDSVSLAEGGSLQIRSSRLHFMSSPTPSPLNAALQDDELKSAFEDLNATGALEKRGVKVYLTPSNIDDLQGIRPEFEDQYLLAPAEYAGLFGPEGKPKMAWRQLIVPYLVVRRLLLGSTIFRQDSGLDVSHAKIPQPLDLRPPFSGPGGSNRRSMVYLHPQPEKGERVVSIRNGEDYYFTRMLATTLAQTAIILITSAFNPVVDVDCSLADPVGALIAVSRDPKGARVELTDGSYVEFLQLGRALLESARGVKNAREALAGTNLLDDFDQMLASVQMLLRWINR